MEKCGTSLKLGISAGQAGGLQDIAVHASASSAIFSAPALSAC